MPTALVLVFLLLSLGASSTMAQAAPAAPGSADDSEPPEYRELVDDAVVQFRAGRYAEARALFIRAHDVFPNARTARGIGLCAFELREYVHAVDKLELALRHEVRPLTDAMRGRVQEVLEDARRFVAVYTIEVDPAAAEVTVDGMAVDVDAELILPIGTHDLEADRAGFRTLRRQIVVRGGEREVLALTMRVGESSRRGAREEPATWGSGWLLAGAIAAAGGTAAGVLWWVSRQLAVNDCDHPPDDYLGHCYPDNRSAIETERNAAIAVTVGAAAASGTMLVLWLTGGDAADERADVTCAPGFGSVVCSGRF